MYFYCSRTLFKCVAINIVIGLIHRCSCLQQKFYTVHHFEKGSFHVYVYPFMIQEDRYILQTKYIVMHVFIVAIIKLHRDYPLVCRLKLHWSLIVRNIFDKLVDIHSFAFASHASLVTFIFFSNQYSRYIQSTTYIICNLVMSGFVV